jgi:iron complex transport system ATP-binding protein
VILAMHDLNLAARYCDHLVVLGGGRTVCEGAPEVVLDPALLLEVYGVRASVVRPEGGQPLHVIYNGALPYDSVSKPD